MSKVLDTYSSGTVADAVLEFVDDLGFPPEEAIPGLIIAVRRLASSLRDEEGALDEAANLLADL